MPVNVTGRTGWGAIDVVWPFLIEKLLTPLAEAKAEKGNQQEPEQDFSRRASTSTPTAEKVPAC